MRRNKQYYIRKIHRFLGVFLGIQFLLWTLGGLYFSWTDIDEIHGDHLISEQVRVRYDPQELRFSLIPDTLQVKSAELLQVLGEPYFFVNDHLLYHARTGELRGPIVEEEAKAIANSHLAEKKETKSIVLLQKADKHHEYRERRLPAWQVNYVTDDNISIYIDATNGQFVRVRHQQWRWFDFLWMMHTMDYEGRDDMNNLLLRAFSLLG
ncbi:MAG: PepSY domain-containing protein, partial [Cyclobacteriaceae bacterium]